MLIELSGYLSLALSAFVSATLLPFGSELVLVGLAHQGFNSVALWAVATFCNTLGSCLNWYLGREVHRFAHKRWFPFSSAQLLRAEQQFARYGGVSLLFAWLPVVGDPLTFIAGVLKTRFWLFFLLVAVGKGIRYAVLLWLISIGSAS